MAEENQRQVLSSPSSDALPYWARKDYEIGQNIQGEKNNLDQILGMKSHWHVLCVIVA